MSGAARMTMTLAEARQKWERMREEDGGLCPCCDRHGKNYRRGINHTMAASIAWLSHMTTPDGEFIRVPKTAPRFVLGSNQLPTMRWWDMCERKPSKDPAKKHSGQWRVTEKGVLFATNRLRVPKYVWTYNADVLSTEGPLVLISECIDSFDYEEVMSVRYNPRPPPKIRR
jgi:hypothetical protein